MKKKKKKKKEKLWSAAVVTGALKVNKIPIYPKYWDT